MFTATLKLFNSTNKLLTDLLFPRFCVGCGQEDPPAGGWLCSQCAGDIVSVVSQVCPECGKLSENGQYHLKCSKGKALKGIIAASYFEEGPVREMIHNLKYNGVTELVKPLGEMMAKVLRDEICEMRDKTLISQNSFLLTFTPLHWRRKAQRGYNQSELLAREIGKNLNIDVMALLIKKKSTKRQVELQGSARRENLKDVFVAREGLDIAKKKIIIVDDVYTTGSTLNECARVLKKEGVKEVWGLVIARG